MITVLNGCPHQWQITGRQETKSPVTEGCLQPIILPEDLTWQGHLSGRGMMRGTEKRPGG